MAPVFNFSAGPGVLPRPVLERAQAELVDFQGLGYSLMEASHRSPEFEAVLNRAESNFRQLLGIGDDYAVLFLQGGASLQFSMLPINLLPAGQTAAYVDTGVWSDKAIKEAKLLGNVKLAASSKASKYDRIPAPATWDVPADSAYLHFTSNNTIYGTQFRQLPPPVAGVPLVCDMSSDIMSRPVKIADYGMIYAGAQKNLGPSGVTVVILRKDLADRVPATTPTMLKYSTHIQNQSMFNTPPTWGIYILTLVSDWLIGLGGIPAIQKINDQKAKLLYDVIDEDGFYRCPAQVDSRSHMNVVFRLPTEALEDAFAKVADEEQLLGLKGHRSVGGMRASIYNAMPLAGVEKLAAVMRAFRAKHG